MANKGYTVRDLADEFQVSIGTMRKWLVSLGVAATGSSKTVEGRGRPALTYPASTVTLLKREKATA